MSRFRKSMSHADQSLEAQHGADDGPLLEPPALLADRRYLGASAIATLGLGALVMMAMANDWSGMQRNHPSSGAQSNMPSYKLSASELPGALSVVDQALAAGSDHVFKALIMPQDEKVRLKQELIRSPMRIGRLTVWDTFDQDDDRIRITASGFSQDVVIGHSPTSFFIPYLPGADVRVTALHEGGGGGVTLGVRTALGPVLLQRIAPGQTVEIAVP